MSNKVTRFNKIGVAGRRADGGTQTDPFLQTFTIPVVTVASTSAQQTGVKLPDQCSIIDAVVNVITPSTAGTTETVDVGGAASDDIIDGAVTTSAGFASGALTTKLQPGSEVQYTLGSADMVGFTGEIVITVIGSD